MLKKKDETTFKIVEVSEEGIVVVHSLRGTDREIRKGVSNMKKKYKRCEMFGKEGMVVWS